MQIIREQGLIYFAYTKQKKQRKVMYNYIIINLASSILFDGIVNN